MTSIFTSQSINYPDGLPSVGIVPSRSFASCVIICFFSFFACIYFFKIKYSIFKDRRNFCFTCSLISRQNCYTTSIFLQSNKYSLSELGHRLYSLQRAVMMISFTTCLTFNKQFISTQTFITTSKTKCRWHLNFLKSVYLGFWRMIETFIVSSNRTILS